MDNLGQAGCVDIIIDRINRDLSERQFGFGGESKCEPFPTGLCKPPIGTQLNGGQPLCDTFASRNESRLKDDSRIELSTNNPLISDLLGHGKLMDALAIQSPPKPLPLQFNDLNGAYHPTNQPVNCRSDEPEQSVIDLNYLNQPNRKPLKSELQKVDKVSNLKDQVELIDKTEQVNTAGQDLEVLPMPEFSSFTVSSDAAQSSQKVRPCFSVHSNTAKQPTEQPTEKPTGCNEELGENNRVSNDDCSS